MKSNKIRLLDPKDKDYFLEGIQEFYRTIENDRAVVAERKTVRFRRLKSYLLRKMVVFPGLLKLKPAVWNNKRVNFSAMISGDLSVLMPYSLFSQSNYVYMHDAWPRFQHWIFPLLEFFHVKVVFFSAKQSWMDHQRKCPNSTCKSMWVPEGIDADLYIFRPFGEKKIDVLEFGRRYEKYHLLIKDRLAAENKHHIFKTDGKTLLFPDQSAFKMALAETKIVVCVPSDLTHPDRAEYISSMTLRYLQAMASKCLIVGITPYDMKELFSYSPIVEIDMDNAAEQLLDVLANYNAYIPLIERNYLEVKNNHQWKNRWNVIKETMYKSI